jgi:magnesium-transporting ATPase (P-type)
VALLFPGADNVIYERLKKQATSDTYALQTDEHLKLFATQGLRTLCLAKRDVSKAEWAAWEPTYQEVSFSYLTCPLPFRLGVRKSLRDVCREVTRERIYG